MTCSRLATVCATLLAARLAGAIINPTLTPVHVVRGAKQIAAVRLVAGGCTVESALKGSIDGQHALTVAARDADEGDTLRRMLQAADGTTAMLFAAGKTAFLHVGGNWLALEPAGARRWRVTGFARKMSAVYAGGTDMLLRMTRYILAEPRADAPTTVGTRWFDRVKLGEAKDATGMAVLRTDSGPVLFVASSRGDCLFRPKDDESFTEERLQSRSRQFAWLDWNGDGQADLASWDGTAVQVCGAVVHRSPCLGLAPIAGGLLVSSSDLPVLLRPDQDAQPLPSGKAVAKAGSAPAACVVADLDGDGFPDVLQPRERGGVLWRGNAAGFAAPVASAVAARGGAVHTAVGDFDGDGALDLFLSDAKGARLWENDGKAAFRDVTDGAGSLSYKMPGGIAACLATDLNHDGRTDIALGYGDSAFAYHFNRGFRCFGEQGELRLTGGAFDDGPPPGVHRLAAGDLNDDGGLDLAVVFATGELFVYWNQRTDAPRLLVQLPNGVRGPVTVSAWQGKGFRWCVGTHRVRGGVSTLIPLRSPGTCQVRYRIGDRPPQVKTLSVGKEAVQVSLDLE